MTKQELEKLMMNLAQNIKDLYLSEYPNGGYLNITIFKDTLAITNDYTQIDKEYPIHDFGRADNVRLHRDELGKLINLIIKTDDVELHNSELYKKLRDSFNKCKEEEDKIEDYE